MIKTENQRTFGLALVCMFLFAGCGGGGGGGGGALAPDDLRDLARARAQRGINTIGTIGTGSRKRPKRG